LVPEPSPQPRPSILGTLRKHGLVFFFAAVFGMAAYGVIKLLIFASDRLGLPI
jgi:hypothetical protein